MKWIFSPFLFISCAASAQEQPLIRLESSPIVGNKSITLYLLELGKDTMTYYFKDKQEFHGPAFVSVEQRLSDTESKNTMRLVMKNAPELNTVIKQGYKYLYVSRDKGKWFLSYANEYRKEE